jgi:hypothetical protein
MLRLLTATTIALSLILGTGSIDDGPKPKGTCKKGAIRACGGDNDGVFVELMSRGQVRGLPEHPGEGALPADEDAPFFEYVSLPDCDGNNPNRGPENGVLCVRALMECPPELVGNNRLTIWRRLVTPPDEAGVWRTVGVTCHSDIAPGARARLTMEQIRAAFMRTPWAEPRVRIQPEGEVTLVNLKTFFRVSWGGEGFEPGEVDVKTLLGVRVHLRPMLVGFTYEFGDGVGLGPTVSAGGVWPEGDVTHVYSRRGEFGARVVTTFGGEVSLDGREWFEIPQTVQVPGPVTRVTVREARAVLVND